jgi:hypothetical protein
MLHMLIHTQSLVRSHMLFKTHPNIMEDKIHMQNHCSE